MKIPRTLRSRLILSHLGVALVSIVLMAVFAGRFIFQAALAEAEHNLQGLAFAAGNALQLPIQEVNQGIVPPSYVQDLLSRMFADSPEMSFTVYRPDGFPMADSSGNLPPRANRLNAPEVIEALESEFGRSVIIRQGEDGQTRIYVALLIQREIEVIGILRLSVPLAPTMEAARRSFLVLIVLALSVAGGISLIGWVLANSLSRPIQVLTQAAQQMEQGDLSVRVAPSGPEELQRLATAFNRMAGRLQANVNELRAFVANASHELRTPLTAIKLRVEALREGALEDREIGKRFLGEIDSEVDRLVQMVNDLLDLSRMEAGLVGGERHPLDLGAMAEEVYETFHLRAERAEVSLTLDVEEGLPPVLGDEEQLRRLLYNLLENAIKYTPCGGQVDLILRRSPKENMVRLLVRDNGPGIPPEHLPHVFERFYRADPLQPRPGVSRGSGLGLAIAKSIVESHGGEIGVSSQVGSGSTFWADLPVAPPLTTS